MPPYIPCWTQITLMEKYDEASGWTDLMYWAVQRCDIKLGETERLTYDFMHSKYGLEHVMRL